MTLVWHSAFFTCPQNLSLETSCRLRAAVILCFLILCFKPILTSGSLLDIVNATMTKSLVHSNDWNIEIDREFYYIFSNTKLNYYQFVLSLTQRFFKFRWRHCRLSNPSTVKEQQERTRCRMITIKHPLNKAPFSLFQRRQFFF